MRQADVCVGEKHGQTNVVVEFAVQEFEAGFPMAEQALCVGIQLRPSPQRFGYCRTIERKLLERDEVQLRVFVGGGSPLRYRCQKVEARAKTQFGNEALLHGRPARYQIITPDEDVQAFGKPIRAGVIGVVETARKRDVTIHPIDLGLGECVFVVSQVQRSTEFMIPPVEKSIQAPVKARGNGDVIVIGAGIFGLWAARHAIGAGKSVIVLEKRKVGAGASGGFLGALMPHMPDRWNEKKQMQFDALSTIAAAIAELEDDTGLDCGFRRCGRLMPVRSEKSVHAIMQRCDGAAENWPGFSMELVNESELASDNNWFGPDETPLGAVHDTLSARVDPRVYLGALAAFVRANGRLEEGADIVAVDPAKGVVTLGDGGQVLGGEIVVAAGWEAYPLLAPFMTDMTETDGPHANGFPGRGVKGQAVLLGHEHGDTAPILYDNGAYVVPHSANRVAIGSTTVEGWQASETPGRTQFADTDLSFLERARKLAPRLDSAPVIERWANVRPRNMLLGRGTEPFTGKVPGHDNLRALIGGFKIGVGVAHLAGAQW